MNKKQFQKRVKKIRQTIKCPFIIGKNANFRYFAGVGGLSGAIIFTKKEEYLISSDYELANKTAFENIIQAKNKKDLFEFLREHKIKKIGMDFSTISAEQYRAFIRKGFTPVDIGNKLRNLREIKEETEINCIKKACKLADKAMNAAQDFLNEGVSERELRSRAINHVLDKCEDIAFSFIVASGGNSLFTHPLPSNREIKKGDTVIVDLGLKVRGYHSDITRTFMVKPDKRQKETYSAVKDAHNLAVNSLKRGAKCSDISRSVYNFFKSKKLEKCVKYGLGHGVGLEIHESPSLNKQSKDVLKNNMVFTVEPGLHARGLGGVRIEDTVLLTKKGPEFLTRFPRGILKV